MKAAVLHELNKPMTIEDFEIPGIGPDEVLIQVKACGVCHTDFKVIEGRIPSRVPTIIGHEAQASSLTLVRIKRLPSKPATR
jgi:Zn-dependent alcohol dehydrogenase